MIELLIAMAIMSIVSVVVVQAFANLGRTFTTQNVASEAQQSLRISTEFMARDIRLAGLDPEKTDNFNILTSTSTTIKFEADKNLNGTLDGDETISYTYNSDTLWFNDGGTTELLQDNIDTFEFSYFDKDGTELTGTIDSTQVSSVGINVTVEYPAGRGDPIVRTYSTMVRCRNIGL